MTSNFILFNTCLLFFLQLLNIEVGNAQKYSYGTAEDIASKFTRKDLEMAGPLIDNAVDFVLNYIFQQSNSSNHTSECIKALENSAGNAFSCKYTLNFIKCCCRRMKRVL